MNTFIFTEDRPETSVSHNQIALLCLSETWKKKKNHFYFLQCLILQPQCKHSLTLLFGFIKLTFKKTQSKKKKKKKERKNQTITVSFLSSFALWDGSTSYTVHSLYTCLLFNFKSWRPVADATSSIWSWLLMRAVKQTTGSKN